MFILTVIRGDGIDGFPETGTYSYELNSTAFYNYYTSGTYANPEVQLDKEIVPLKGTITMNRNYTLEVSCEKVDYTGDWLGTFTWIHHNVGMCNQPDDGVNVDMFFEHDGRSLAITIPSLDLVLNGGINEDLSFSATQEKGLVDDPDVIYEYQAHGKFVSITEFSGELKITGYRDTRESTMCFSRADFTGTKK
jgi:hypothetical protein